MIHLEAVEKSHPRPGESPIQALQPTDLHLTQPGIVLLKGPSGSGKSTLLSLIGAMSRPSAGKITVLDQDITRLPDRFASRFRRETMGFIFQSFHLLPQLTLLENILLPLIPTDHDRADALQKAESMAALLQLTHRLHTSVERLSGGEKQRTAIARALITDPAIILADEPTANLDSKAKALFLEQLALLKSNQRLILIATHDPVFDQAGDLIDRTMEMRDGVLIS